MPLEFRENAICLSGGTGTGLKSRLLGKYYPFWWGITSGGKTHNLETTIVDMDAATGEVCLADTGQVVPGSAGHALSLKLDNQNTNLLKVILVEKDPQCYARLRQVISKHWPQVPMQAVEGPIDFNSSGVYTINGSLDEAVAKIQKIDNQTRLGRTIFLFDPLLCVPWESIQQVARKRITSFYKIGTEFIVFLFTSDFFLGRDDFSPLPNTMEEDKWSLSETASVAEADALFSGKFWRSRVLNDRTVEEKERKLVETYRRRLHSWFRYVLPLPFAPKVNQIYHLFVCSNYEIGIRVTRSFFCDLAKNPKLSQPPKSEVYTKFKQHHPSKVNSLPGGDEPLEFQLLWHVITSHEEGFCDVMSQDLMKEDRDPARRRAALEWLWTQNYLRLERYEDEWGRHPPTYMLNWKTVCDQLGVYAPPPLRPLMP